MNKIEIIFNEFTGNCILLPEYNIEADLLEISSKISRQWKYGMNINGNLIFDIDNDLKIANCDLLIPKRLWKKKGRLPFDIISEGQNYTDISFSKSSIEIKNFNIEIEVFSFKDNVYILLDKPNKVVINKLSDKCEVLTFNNELKGFIVRDMQ